MLQAGVVKPSGAALSAEQLATFKAGLVKHLPLPGEAAHASLDASEASRGHIRSLAKSPALLRALGGHNDETNLVPLVNEVDKCLSFAEALASAKAGAELTIELAQAIVFGRGSSAEVLALGKVLSEAQKRSFVAWTCDAMGSDEHRRSTQLCTQSIQATLATCRNWITETFKCNIDLHNLEDEAVLLRHATLHVDIDVPGAIHVLMSLPNTEHKVLELTFLSMLSVYTRDLSNLALLRKRADRKDRKANEDRVKAVVDLLGRLQALTDFHGQRHEGCEPLPEGAE